MRILLTISYLGTAYHGWQVQPNGITVQEKMQDALEKMYTVRPALTGCSRTDAGVHALEFCCHYDTDKEIPLQGIVAGLNTYLPSDIAVLSAKRVDNDFHARYNAKGKHYVYKIYNQSAPNPFLSDRAWHIPHSLDENKMNRFLSDLVGTHDFVAFAASGRTVEDTVRTISECKITRQGNELELSVTADGFLYNMVRIITGTAVDVSYGRIDPEAAPKILKSLDRSEAGFTAPAHGLYLNKVIY